MSDYSELERAASAAKNWGGEVGEGRWYAAECFKRPYYSAQDAEFIAACDPGQILVLIAENESARKHWQNESNNVQALVAEVGRLKAENERLRTDYAGLASFNPEWDRVAAAQDSVREHMEMVAQLRAEVAGLRTGYEAYERVNAELKAENEALRNALRPLLAHWDDLKAGESINVDAARAAMGKGEQS